MPNPPEPAPEVDGDFTIVLPANGTTVAAEEVQAALVLAADHADEIRIDASQVENVGQAMLQLLVAARAEAEAKDLDFLITDPSRAFAERVRTCRLAEALGLAEEELQS